MGLLILRSSAAAGGGGAAGFTENSGFTVTAIDGNWNAGSRVRIQKTGGGFGTKPGGPKPLKVFTFESDTAPHATYSRNTTGYTAGGGTLVTTGPLMANMSAHLFTDMTSPTNVNGSLVNFATGQWYRCSPKNYNWTVLDGGLPAASPAGTNLKTERMRALSGTNDTYTHEGDSNEPTGQGVITFENVGSAQNQYFGPSLPADTWIHVEMFGRSSSAADVQDGIRNYIKDGKHVITPNTLFITKTAGNTGDFDQHNLDQISNNAETAGSGVYLALDYFDDSWCRILHSDEATYAETDTGVARKRWPLSSYAWADDELEAYILQHPYNLSGRHLKVINSAGTSFDVGAWN